MGIGFFANKAFLDVSTQGPYQQNLVIGLFSFLECPPQCVCGGGEGLQLLTLSIQDTNKRRLQFCSPFCWVQLFRDYSSWGRGNCLDWDWTSMILKYVIIHLGKLVKGAVCSSTAAWSRFALATVILHNKKGLNKLLFNETKTFCFALGGGRVSMQIDQELSGIP